ncbi:MAG: hypothetical protein ACHQRM_01550 [Bacteroidia bacterium]
MKTAAIKKELNVYIPMLSVRQQEIILSMIKNILNVDPKEKRLTRAQYNKELMAAEKRIDKGEYYTQEEVENKLRK